MLEPTKPNRDDYPSDFDFKSAQRDFLKDQKKYKEKLAREEKIKLVYKYSIFAFIGLIVLMFALGSFYTVPERHVGIVKRFGEAIDQTNPGIHYKIPMFDSIELMEIGIRKYEITMPVATISKGQAEAELQLPSHVTIAANWNIPEKNALEIFRTYGGLEQFEDRVLDPRVIRSTKAEFSKHSIEHIISNRESIRVKIADPLRVDLSQRNVTLSDFSIKDIKFNAGIQKAILQKQQAKLEAEKEKHTLEQQNLTAQQQVNTANAERDSKKSIADGNAYKIRTEAKAEADAIRLKGEAEAAAIKAKAAALKNNPLIVDLTHQQQWNGQYPSTMMGEGSNILWNMQK